MSKYILKHRRIYCIGCGTCEAIAPDYWKMGSDGKANLKMIKIRKGDFEVNKEAADSCPSVVIKIIKIKTPHTG